MRSKSSHWEKQQLMQKLVYKLIKVYHLDSHGRLNSHPFVGLSWCATVLPGSAQPGSMPLVFCNPFASMPPGSYNCLACIAQASTWGYVLCSRSALLCRMLSMSFGGPSWSATVLLASVPQGTVPLGSWESLTSIAQFYVLVLYRTEFWFGTLYGRRDPVVGGSQNNKSHARHAF